ncbi:MAG: hypothetical protein U0175_06590 [Caldilineaceae bacterium]
MEPETPQAEKPKRKRAPRQKKAATEATTPKTSAKAKTSAVAETVTPEPAPAMSAKQSAELDRLIRELNELAEELKRTAQYTPPPFSPQAMAALLRENVGKFSPNLQVPVLSELKQNLEGTKPEDLLNPDTWKGMWYILNYTAQAQSEQLKTKLSERLAEIPGASVLFDLRSSFEGAKPSDFLDINTWKGVAFILDHTLRTQANEIKKKLLGGEEE